MSNKTLHEDVVGNKAKADFLDEFFKFVNSRAKANYREQFFKYTNSKGKVVCVPQKKITKVFNGFNCQIRVNDNENYWLEFDAKNSKEVDLFFEYLVEHIQSFNMGNESVLDLDCLSENYKGTFTEYDTPQEFLNYYLEPLQEAKRKNQISEREIKELICKMQADFYKENLKGYVDDEIIEQMTE